MGGGGGGSCGGRSYFLCAVHFLAFLLLWRGARIRDKELGECLPALTHLGGTIAERS